MRNIVLYSVGLFFCEKTQEMCFSKWKYAQVLTIYLFDENFKFCFILGMDFNFLQKQEKKDKISLEGKNVRKSGSWIIYCYLQHTCLPYFWSKTLGGRAAVEDYSAVGVSKSLVEARAQNIW